MDTVCITSPEYISGIVGSVVVGASTIANFIPAPDQITNPIFRSISRVIHFIALDIVTSKK